MIGIRITQAKLQVGFILNMLFLKGLVAFMKYYVCRHKLESLVFVTILYNLVCLVAIILTAMDTSQIESKYIMVSFIIAIFVLNIALFSIYKTSLTKVIFENDKISCQFLNKVTRKMLYDNIEEYGVFYRKGVKFIYISQIFLSDSQRDNQIFQLYKKSQDIIILQYQDAVMQFLTNRKTN